MSTIIADAIMEDRPSPVELARELLRDLFLDPDVNPMLVRAIAIAISDAEMRGLSWGKTLVNACLK